MKEVCIMLFVALLPVAVLLFYIYGKDRVKPEPVGQLVKAFGLGVVSIFVSLAISLPLGMLGLFPGEAQTFLDSVKISFLGAAFPEEVAKFAMLWLALRNNRWFDEKMDGIVYAVCVSMGFAALENVMYVFQNEEFVTVAILRAFTALPGHFCFGILMGYYFSLARFYHYGSRRNMLLALVAPIVAHGIYDSLLFAMSVSSSALVSVVLMVVLVFFCFKLWSRSSRSIHEHLMRDKDTEILDNL